MRRGVLLILMLALLAAGGVVVHGSGEEPESVLRITWASWPGGGGPATGNGYSLLATAGQPFAGTLSGGSYTVAGGFWAVEFEPLSPELYLPLVLSR